MKIKSINIINFLIFFSTFLIIINFSNFVFERSIVQYSDWLINYQGGFVRRGLIGEIFFNIHKLFRIPLDFLIFFIVSFFYLVFAFYFVKILKRINLNFLNLLILLSPLSFFYPFMEQKVSGRKDILFILSILIICTFLEKIKFKNQKYLVLALALISTFSHSGFFVYLPLYLLAFIAINYKQNLKSLILEVIKISTFFLVLFFLILFNTSIGDQEILKICKSVKDYLPKCSELGYVTTLNWSLSYEIQLVEELWNKDNYIIFYLFAFIIANLPLAYAFYVSKINMQILNKFNPLLLFVSLCLVTFPIYYIGADYGRYMYISYLSLLIIYFKSISNGFITTKKINFKIKKFFVVIVLFFFGFTWTIPHCCNNNFKFIYAKPITKIFEKINN